MNCEHIYILNESNSLVCYKCADIQAHYVTSLENSMFKASKKEYNLTIYNYRKNILKLLIKNKIMNAYFQDFVLNVIEYLYNNKNTIRLTKLKNEINTCYQYFYKTDELIFTKIKKK